MQKNEENLPTSLPISRALNCISSILQILIFTGLLIVAETVMGRPHDGKRLKGPLEKGHHREQSVKAPHYRKDPRRESVKHLLFHNYRKDPRRLQSQSARYVILTGGYYYAGRGFMIQHQKWRETKQQPSVLPGS